VRWHGASVLLRDLTRNTVCGVSTTGRPPGGSSGRTPGGSGGRPSGGARPGPARQPSPSAKSAVYRRRRFAVGLIALLVLVGLGFGIAAIAGAFGDDDEPAGDVTPTPTASTTPAPTVSATAGYQPEACLPTVLEIRDGASTTSFAVGQAVPFDITLTNSGTVPCLIEGGSATLGVVVYSGSDRIWSSVDCPQEPTERELLLDVGIAGDLAVTWDQVRSAPGCPEGQPTAQPGTYKALVTLDGGGSAALGWERVFTIE
jgi:hypothetical protein